MVLPTAACCDSDCSPTVTSGPPGNPGAAGAAGTNGTDGQNAWDTLASGFTMPAEGATVTIELTGTTDWLVNTETPVTGHILAIQFAGYLEVISITDATHALVKNIGDAANGKYATNAGAGTPIPALARVCSAGLQGPIGITPSTSLLKAMKLSDLPLPISDARNNLGLGSIATFTQGVVNGAVAIIDNIGGLINGQTVFATAAGIESKTAATARTALGLALGTNVQAYDALLAAIAALVTAADKMIYSTGIDTVALTALTSTSRDLLAQTSTVAWRDVLGGVKLGYGIIGGVNGFNVNSAGFEETIPVSTYFGSSAARYRIDKIMVVDKSGAASLTTATLGVFSATGGGGTTLAADQALSAITAATKFVDLALQTLCSTDALTIPTLYVRCGTPQGAAALVDVYVWGWALNLV